MSFVDEHPQGRFRPPTLPAGSSPPWTSLEADSSTTQPLVTGRFPRRVRLEGKAATPPSSIKQFSAPRRPFPASVYFSETAKAQTVTLSPGIETRPLPTDVYETEPIRMPTGTLPRVPRTPWRTPLIVEKRQVLSTPPLFAKKQKIVLGIFAPLFLLLITGATFLITAPLSHNSGSNLGLSLHQSHNRSKLAQASGLNLDHLAAQTMPTPVPTATPQPTPTAVASQPADTGSVVAAPTPAPTNTPAIGDTAVNSTGGSNATTASGSGNWPVGQCTYWANLRYHELTGYWVPWSGNAADWLSGARAANWMVSSQPHIPSIIVLMPGVQGANSSYGHVAVAEELISSTEVESSTMNWYANGGGFNIQSTWDFTTGSGVYFVWHP